MIDLGFLRLLERHAMAVEIPVLTRYDREWLMARGKMALAQPGTRVRGSDYTNKEKMAKRMRERQKRMPLSLEIP